MLVLPNEKKGARSCGSEFFPLFEDTQVLAQLSTGVRRDKKTESITLTNGFEMSLAWAGSAAAMTSTIHSASSSWTK